MKKLLSLILAVAMVLGTTSFGVFAEEIVEEVALQGEVNIATVNGMDYPTIADAIANANEGDTVLVNSDPGAFTIDKAITIQGAELGVEKVGINDYQYITIAEGIDGKVTIDNLAFNGTTNHIIIFSGNDFSNLELELTNCYIEYNANRGIYVDKELEALSVTGCTIDNKSNSYVGSYAIWTNPTAAKTMNISNNNIVGASLLRGAIHIGDYATNGAEIIINENNISGVERGVQVANQSSNVNITVSNNTFSNIKLCAGSTKTEEECAAVFIHKNAKTDVEIDITGNTASESNAIIYSENSADTEEFIGEYSDNLLNDSYVNVEGEVCVAQIEDKYFTSLEKAAAAINTDGSDTTIKILEDIETGTIEFNYGTGNVIFTADKPVVIKQKKVADWGFTIGTDTGIVVEENVTFQIYDNASGMYLYYGPSLTINGSITGGANWGVLYLFNGEHIVSETGKVSVGRIQTAFDTLEVKGEVDTNYLLVEGAEFVADGAIIDANVIYDNNNGGQRWGSSEFVIKNGSEVKTSKLDISYEDSTLTIDTESSLTANKIVGKGTICVDVTNYDGYKDLSNVVVGDFSGFTGKVEAIGGAAEVELVGGKLVIKAVQTGGPIIGYTSENSIWGETRGNAKESYEIKVYSNDTYLGKTSLNNVGGIIDGDVNVSWNIKLDAASNNDEYWTMSWDIAPSMENQPTHVALVIDGKEVDRAEIKLSGPDDINKIYAAITDADGKILSYQTSLENAFNKVKNGESIELFRDVELKNTISFAKDIAFTLDGNGYSIKPAKNFSATNSVFNFGQGNDSTRATRKYDIKNVVFDGWKTEHVVRLQGTTSVIEGCTFRNCNQTSASALGLVTITFADVVVDECLFEDNSCIKCIDVNSWGDDSASASIIRNSTFENNIVSGPGVVYYNDGEALAVENNKFVDNAVETTGNGATVYMGFNDGIKVTGNLFEGNTVTTTHATTKRVAGAIFAGYTGVEGTITNNAFINNAASGGSAPANAVVYSAYYAPGNLDGNYWGGGEPVIGEDFTHEYSANNDLTVEEYYNKYSNDTDGDIVLSELKPIVSKVVAVQYIENKKESDADNGLKVYDIVIVAKDEHIINRLNTADLTFANSSDKIAYEIVAAKDITLTHNTDYPNRYMFNFDGKDDVKDTDVALTIGQVRFTGYDAFVFNISEVSTNFVTATTLDDNIVSYYAADGLVLNEDVDGVGGYLGIIDTVIAVPTRKLTIKIDFPNAVNKNDAAYQDMKIEITGNIDGVNKTVEYELGNDMVDGSYVVTEDRLVLNNAYTVTVSGAGYRTARYTVTMTEDKVLKFWNNVMDEKQFVEIGKESSKVNVTFLAGDIVKDNKINIYDLSAVVSYFGTETKVEKADSYAKYDLNRDGVIDSKDVAYVLVSWDN